jgi:hypothetical protein
MTTDVVSIPSANRWSNRVCNQMIETMLRLFINLMRSYWVELQPLDIFAYKNSTTNAHEMMPFSTNYGHHPSIGTAPTRTNILSPSSLAYGP